MNRSLYLLFLIPVFILGFIETESYSHMQNSSFTTGEKLEYRVHYGFINAGEADITIDKDTHTKNGRPCYLINVFGKTTGAVEWTYKIRNNWGTYLDTTYLVPQEAFRMIRENKYRKTEITIFDHKRHNAEVKVWNREEKKYKESKNYKVPNGVQDLVSGYYYLRNIDYNKIKIGEIIKINAFFEDSLYDFRVRYLGREVLKTKVGNMKSLKLSPIMPDNDLFSGENAVQVWLSDDSNKIPLKIKADLIVGAVELDIKKYSGLRNGSK